MIIIKFILIKIINTYINLNKSINKNQKYKLIIKIIYLEKEKMYKKIFEFNEIMNKLIKNNVFNIF